ncbi:TIGR02391 family protein [Streptomyces mutabilis]|uniref:TIGR02391 family protein n=1 Tax=Streptomyces mutabilis TaxID=67332 RepID=UPI003698B2C1
MDRDWMRQRLESFEALATEYLGLKGPTVGRTLLSSGTTQPHPKAGALRAELYAAEPTLKKILRCIDPEMPQNVYLETAGGVARTRDEVRRALGALTDMDEWATRLAPDAPSLPADQFHPWVWDAARTFWESKHFRAAVHAAASSVSAHLQNKLGRRDVTDATLVQEALSNNAPEPGKPRLRIPGDPTDPDVKTRQRGALLLGQGAYSALRNPAAHGVTDLPEQAALEQLATFSVVARLIDQCQVMT